jgi:hypothetical protein
MPEWFGGLIEPLIFKTYFVPSCLRGKNALARLRRIDFKERMQQSIFFWYRMPDSAIIILISSGGAPSDHAKQQA